jgi:hypothetical protein
MKELFENLRKKAEQERSKLSDKEKAEQKLASFLLFDKMQSPYDNAMNEQEFEKTKDEGLHRKDLAP